MHQLKIRVSGNVQGVSFRASAKDQADKLGLSGFAKNQDDGTVYIEVEGDAEKLEAFANWCKQGSVAATVENVETTKDKPSGHQDFEIY